MQLTNRKWTDNFKASIWLHTLCKPNLAALNTNLEVEVVPEFENTPHSETDLEARDGLIKEINRAFSIATKKKSTIHELQKNINKRQGLIEFEKQYIKVPEHSQYSPAVFYQFSKNFFAVQQALFEGIYLFGLLKEDPYKEKFPGVMSLINAYEETIKLQNCSLIDRMRLNQFFDKKSYQYRGSVNCKMNRIAAQEFMLLQRQEKPNEALTIFTQLMYNYHGQFWYFDTE